MGTSAAQALELLFLQYTKQLWLQSQRNGSAIQPYEGASEARADVVNRLRDQFLARARFSVDQYSGTGGRDAFDLFEYRFQSEAIAYDLLESALITVLVSGRDFFARSTVSSGTNSHKGSPGAPGCVVPLLISALQSHPNHLKELLVIERFRQKFHCPRSQRLQSQFF